MRLSRHRCSSGPETSAILPPFEYVLKELISRYDFRTMARQPERKRDMIKVLFPGLRRSRSRTPDPSTSGTPPPNQTTVPTSLPIRQIQDDQEKYSASLWESALKTLTPDEMKICEQYKGLELNAIASLLSVVKAKQQECEKHQWKFRLFNKEVKFQNVAGNIASYLVKLQGVGDMVASFDSMHAALPWAAVKLLLQVDGLPILEACQVLTRSRLSQRRWNSMPFCFSDSNGLPILSAAAQYTRSYICQN